MKTVILGLLLIASGCDNDETVYGAAHAINNNTNQPGFKTFGAIHANVKTGGSNHFADLTIGGLNQVSGTYTNCAHRSGMWAVPIDGFSGALNWPPLTVLKHDVGCTLTVMRLEPVSPAEVFPMGGNGIVLGTGYPTAATAWVSTTNGTQPLFYANADLDDHSFANNFTITVPFSDDPNLAQGTVHAGYSTVSASANSLLNPAPNYTPDFSALVLQVDANNIIDSITGQAVFTRDPTKGTVYQYELTSDTFSDDYNSIQAEWDAGTTFGPTSVDPFILQASDFGIGTGADLTNPITRTIILSTDWTDPTYGYTHSFQKLTITFQNN